MSGGEPRTGCCAPEATRNGWSFPGVGKSTADIDFGIKCGIDAFNVESASELARLETRTRLLGRKARVSVRVNPDVDANTHAYIATGLKENKFGVPPAQALELYRRAWASPGLTVAGIDCHIGSQIADVEPFEVALTALLDLVDALERDGIVLDHIDIGGGFGITYEAEAALDLDTLGDVLRVGLGSRPLQLRVEPGSLPSGPTRAILLTRVEYLKARSNARVPGLRGRGCRDERPDPPGAVPGVAWTSNPVGRKRRTPFGDGMSSGPVCESGDFLALDPRTGAWGRRPARHPHGGCLRLLAEFQLQQPSAPPRKFSWTVTASRSSASGKRSGISCGSSPRCDVFDTEDAISRYAASRPALQRIIAVLR